MRAPSLHARLLIRVGFGVLLLLCLDALACYLTSLHFANVVYDRWLLDSAGSLGKAVREEQGGAHFGLGRDAEAVFLFDAVDHTYFRISSARSGFLAGDPRFPPAPAGALGGGQRVHDAQFEGQRVRVAAVDLLLAGDRVTIEVAETVLKRSRLADEILLAMVAPQVALLAVAMAWSWWSIGRGLHPLTRLAGELERREPDSLEPFAEHGLPEEARVLVKRLNELLVRVGAVVQGQRQFLADAAHQIRTPLAAVLLHADRALRVDDEDARRESLHILQASVRRASRVSQQLLALARAEPGHAPRSEFRPVDLAVLARQVGAEWVPVALARNIDFGLDVPDGPAWALGHEALLREALSNLVDNALRYGREGGVVTVAVQALPQGGCLLAVEDDGVGIPVPERERVFERFHRVEGSAGDGCGLGLAIVREITRQHGARLRIVDPPAGAGARFEVLFAAAESPAIQGAVHRADGPLQSIYPGVDGPGST